MELRNEMAHLEKWHVFIFAIVTFIHPPIPTKLLQVYVEQKLWYQYATFFLMVEG